MTLGRAAMALVLLTSGSPLTANERERAVGPPPAKAKDQPAVDVAPLDLWVVPPVIASRTRLPSPPGYAVTWSADALRIEKGLLINDGTDAVTVRLTGSLRAPSGAAITKRFHVRVLGGNRRYLVGYSRVPTDAHAANQPVVARSLHLALAAPGQSAVPLNGDYGVLFASGEQTGVDRVALRGLIDPSLFYFADGTIGVIATRIALSGPPDLSDRSSAVIFKGERGRPTRLTELGTIDLLTLDGVVDPEVVWDSAARHYLVSWKDREGVPRWTTVRDLARAAPLETSHGARKEIGGNQIASIGNVGAMRPGTPITPQVDAQDPLRLDKDAAQWSVLPVEGSVAAAFEQRFGRIFNTRAWVDGKTIAPGAVAGIMATRARLSYSDGSVSSRGVDWNAADIKRVATARSGTHLVRGTVRQHRYPGIFAHERADPDIYRYEHAGRVRYLFVATDDTDRNNVGSTHLPIRVAGRIDELADANGGRGREVDILNRITRADRTAEGRVIAGCYWAPELHEIGGRLSILFAPCFNPKDDQSNRDGIWSSVEAHIMQLRAGGDPENPSDWSKPAAVRNADGSKLRRPDHDRNISLDMSYFELRGQAYYTWSQRYLAGPSTPMGDPLTWIAKVDPASPTRLASTAVPVIEPTLSFEENLTEGAFTLIRDGRLTMVYSSSSVSPTYVVGGAWASMTSDPTSPGSWNRFQAPLQKSVPMPAGSTDYRKYEQGTGHGSFTTDEDGNDLYVYHTWGEGVGGSGRDTRVRRVHWAADLRPVLDMTDDEEVAPANRAVTMTVVVKPRRRSTLG